MARVLIVEDEEQVRVLAESYLREQGHYTLSAATPVEALAALGVAEGVNILFVDIGLRDDPHAGLDLAKEATQRKPDLKVGHKGAQQNSTIRSPRRRGRATAARPEASTSGQSAHL